jgi:hypothetical protein
MKKIKRRNRIKRKHDYDDLEREEYKGTKNRDMKKIVIRKEAD